MSEAPDDQEGTPEQPTETPEQPTPQARWAGKYETPEDLEQAYKDLQAKLGEQGNELGELRKLKPGPQVHITHLQPGEEDSIMAEIARHLPNGAPRRLMHGDVIEI